jgi:lipid-binding SYLF domain-containing protein
MLERDRQHSLSVISFILFLLLSTTGMQAQTEKAQDQAQAKEAQNIDKDKLEEAREESREASEVFSDIMKAPDKAIPKEMLDSAHAIAVFPDVIKAALVVGGQGGDGVISRRTPDGWSAPVFFKMTGGSLGAQIGVESTDYILLFMNEGALKGLMEDEFEVGAEASVAAGPVGRTASASTNVTLDAGILSYSRSKGAFIGAALKGAKISPQNDMNRAIYGKTASELLTGPATVEKASMPEGLLSFTDTLNNIAKGTSGKSSGSK